jgi:hypothetical protein
VRWKKAVKEMKSRKVTRDGDVLKLLGEGGLKILTKLINTILEIGEWPKDVTEVKMIALRRRHKLQSAATIAQSSLLHIQQR